MEETKENVANAPEEVTSAANPEAEEYYAQLQRVMADFDNYRKRVVKEKDAQYSVILSEVSFKRSISFNVSTIKFLSLPSDEFTKLLSDSFNDFLFAKDSVIYSILASFTAGINVYSL